jgi:hypothetical protein
MITAPLDGIVIGAIKVVGPPLSVAVSLKDPHELLPQVTVQFTPAATGSFATLAATDAVPLAPIADGGKYPSAN